MGIAETLLLIWMILVYFVRIQERFPEVFKWEYQGFLPFQICQVLHALFSALFCFCKISIIFARLSFPMDVDLHYSTCYWSLKISFVSAVCSSAVNSIFLCIKSNSVKFNKTISNCEENCNSLLVDNLIKFWMFTSNLATALASLTGFGKIYYDTIPYENSGIKYYQCASNAVRSYHHCWLLVLSDPNHSVYSSGIGTLEKLLSISR